MIEKHLLIGAYPLLMLSDVHFHIVEIPGLAYWMRDTCDYGHSYLS